MYLWIHFGATGRAEGADMVLAGELGALSL